MSRGSKQAFLAQQLQEDQIENENDLKTKETTITINKEKTEASNTTPPPYCAYILTF